MPIIAVDKDIPYTESLLGTLGDLVHFDGRTISSSDLRDVDILIVRTVTPVGADLLAGTSVRMVGAASTGTDHIDFDALSQSDISFSSAHGANASAVADYVVAAVLSLAVREHRPLKGLTAGIIGCGQVGSRVARRLPHLGLDVLINDPPLQEAARLEGRVVDFVSIDRILRSADIVTLHVPLQATGRFPTLNLIDAAELDAMGPNTWLFNTSRGGVVSERALTGSAGLDTNRQVVLDVWEREPHIDTKLMQSVSLGTPHIAGYSLDAKWRGVAMMRHAILEFLGRSDDTPGTMPDSEIRPILPPPARWDSNEEFLHGLARQAFDVAAGHKALIDRVLASGRAGPAFVQLRKEFLARRGFETFRVQRSEIPSDLMKAVTNGLGFKI